MSNDLSEVRKAFARMAFEFGFQDASPGRLNIAGRLRKIAGSFQIRRSVAPARIPIVALGYDGSADAPPACRNSGVDGWTPVDVDGFLNAIGAADRRAP